MELPTRQRTQPRNAMSNEPDTTFSGQVGGLQPAGWYTYPPGFGGSTEENPVRKYIPYPFVPGASPVDENPGDLGDK